MKWVADTMGTSVGKKLMMGLTGFCFLGFLVSHLAGNLILYAGNEAFDAYAEKLHSLGPIITIAEWVLLILALIHITTGAFLFYENFSARPERYAVDKKAGGRTWGSATMPYTGIVILLFLLFHLVGFHFVDKTETTISQIVSAAFSNPVYVICYVIAMIAVAFHVRHGLWSAFQTLGANHPKYMPAIMLISLVFSLIVGIGFGLIPIYVFFAG